VLESRHGVVGLNVRRSGQATQNNRPVVSKLKPQRPFLKSHQPRPLTSGLDDLQPLRPAQRARRPASNWRALFGWRRVRTVAILCALFIARKLPTVHHS
jgi:hypothetical protein